jgi:uncharacterized repeat protein (TIGR04076 family)
MASCRIKVLKRLVVPEVAEEYIGSTVGPCPLLSEGQEFVVSSTLEKPPGFCDWAWTDIHKFVIALSRGGNFSYDVFGGWMKDTDSMIACCTDGVRPVIFEIRRLPN